MKSCVGEEGLFIRVLIAEEIFDLGISRLMIVSREAKKKQAVRDE